MKKDVKVLVDEFKGVFGVDEPQVFFAPGRINLIGEHTDYNGGYVFPCAISLGTYAVVSKRCDRELHLYSDNFKDNGLYQVLLDDLSFKKEDGWTNYVKGVFLYLQEMGYQLPYGLNILVYGNIPNGAGLSSSASLELLMGVVAKTIYGLEVSMIDLVKLGKKVENDYIGVNSGIMDQFAVGMGKENHAIQLDCNTLHYQLVPVNLKDEVILIMNTNKRRELADSKYNERFAETRQALKELQAHLDITTLADLTVEELETAKEYLSSDLLVKRARHAVSENERTIKAAELLKHGDVTGFGQLMKESHLSTEIDYQVTGKELDTLVHTAWGLDGVIGARMTGAGFGGCAIALVKKDCVEEVKQAIYNAYLEKIGYAPSFYLAEISDGASILMGDE
ncbi:galactokinase [Granulicatella balaenopterae]|uniref:Galactokinase n=1 Tax=Granulicatella balaenopterae TaxID=137733 RepID=A0A1H9IZX1_9LACT|nr:galactokinase [Granulicatella balaenopterae]SEQ80154.1 galactokinase [Granulicatella balaenopterae]